MIKITNKTIKKLRPCKDRYDNYLKFYKGKEFTPKQFMRLKKITNEDKLWVAFLVLPKKDVRLIAADIAESVLHLYEEKYPNDARPRLAIQASRDFAYGRISSAAGDAAGDAAWAAAEAAAGAARAAARAAAGAAARAAARAAAEDAAWAAVGAAAGAARAAEQKKQHAIILRYWK